MWYCKECLGDKILLYVASREVHVFWPDDNAWYKAYIDCFHPDSHGHRILYYEDCNWEFLNFSDSLVCFTDFRKRELDVRRIRFCSSIKSLLQNLIFNI